MVMGMVGKQTLERLLRFGQWVGGEVFFRAE
jgi:hypothetical protein